MSLIESRTSLHLVTTCRFLVVDPRSGLHFVSSIELQHDDGERELTGVENSLLALKKKNHLNSFQGQQPDPEGSLV